MQIVFLSIRPHVLNDTLTLVERNMSFLDEVCIVSPKNLWSSFVIPGRLRSSFIADDELVDMSTISNDHSLINFKLRQSLASHPKVQSEFIMSDDDYRPLKEISLSTFNNQEKYNSYYFYNLSQWTHQSTSFDKCLQNSYHFLLENDLPTLAYSSHMPQIINKDIFNEALTLTLPILKSYCEWSIYFNYGLSKYPNLFNAPQPYISMNWPDYPNIWKRYIRPGEFLFENYYEHLYNDGDLFSGLQKIPSKSEQLSTLTEKNQRLEAYNSKNLLPWLTHKPLLKPIMKCLNLLPISGRKLMQRILNLAENN